MAMENDDIGFELVAASLRADATDSTAFLSALAVKLTGALPSQTTVRQSGGMFGKKGVRAIDVDLGETRFQLEDSHGRLVATRQKAVRGIVLKNESIALEQWIDELSEALAEEARRSEAGRAALQALLERG